MRLLAAILCTAMLLPAVSHSLDTSSVAARNYDAARDAIEAGNWEQVVTLLRPMAEENPYNGYLWYYLGDAYYQSKRYREGGVAYEEAARLGVYKGGALYNAGCCWALAGEPERAINAIQRSIPTGLQNRERLLREDSDLDSLRELPAFRERVLPVASAEMSREDGWRFDLDYMHRRMEETHFDLYRNISREEWRAELDRIKREVADKEDYEVVTDIVALVARIGDGHTGVRVPREGHRPAPAVYDLPAWHQLPVRFYEFTDGFYVTRAVGAYGELVGKRLVRIGNVTAEEAFARIAPLSPRDNDQQVKSMVPFMMTFTEGLVALGIADDIESVELVVAGANGAEEKTKVTAMPYAHHSRGGDWEDGVDMVEPDPKPAWMFDTDRYFWFEYDEEHDLVFCQFNTVQNTEDESIREFASRLFDFCEEKQADVLVIDVRFNGGGNNTLVKPLVDAAIRSDRLNQRGRLFCITGRQTFSACQNFVNRLQRETDVLIVGEPTGSSPNFVGESNHIWLPFTGLVVRGSSRYWQDAFSDDYRPWVAPDLVAEMSSDDYRAGRDVPMAVILDYLEVRRTAESERTSN